MRFGNDMTWEECPPGMERTMVGCVPTGVPPSIAAPDELLPLPSSKLLWTWIAAGGAGLLLFFLMRPR